MIFEHQNYRGYLKSVFVDRLKRNKAYSLRAFARDLGLSAGGLSKILGGTMDLSVPRASEVAQHLDLSSPESEYLCLLVQLESAKQPDLRARLLERVNTLRPSTLAHRYELTADLFRAISDWYHLAILEYVSDGEPARSEAKDLAKFFGISPPEAEVALERLQRLELIAWDTTQNRWIRTAGKLAVINETAQTAVTKFYLQLLDKAEAAIKTPHAHERVVGTEIFAFDPAQIAQVRARTHAFLDDLSALAKTGTQRKDVYALAVQCFRLNSETLSQGEKNA